MTDTFGLLELPAQVPESEDVAAGDPLLDVLLSFCQSVINFQVADAWRARNPIDPIPVSYTFSHNPALEVFNTNETPALCMWRSDDSTTTHKFSQGYVADDGGLSCLWIPPPMEQEHKALRDTLRNPIKKALRSALAQGRHPAWIVAGDTYYEPEDYGSVLLVHAKCAKVRLGPMKNHTLVLESEDKTARTTFECLFFTLDVLELASDPIPLANNATQPLQSVTNNLSLPDRPIDGEDIEDETV